MIIVLTEALDSKPPQTVVNEEPVHTRFTKPGILQERQPVLPVVPVGFRRASRQGLSDKVTAVVINIFISEPGNAPFALEHRREDVTQLADVVIYIIGVACRIPLQHGVAVNILKDGNGAPVSVCGGLLCQTSCRVVLVRCLVRHYKHVPAERGLVVQHLIGRAVG